MGLEIELLLRADLIKEQSQRALHAAYTEKDIIEKRLEEVTNEIQKHMGVIDVLAKLRKYGTELMTHPKGTRTFKGMKCPKT